jgi:hypothetical protein
MSGQLFVESRDKRTQRSFATIAGRFYQTLPVAGLTFVAAGLALERRGADTFAYLSMGIAVCGFLLTLRAALATGLAIRGDSVVIRSVLKTTRIRIVDVKSVGSDASEKPYSYRAGFVESRVLMVLTSNGRRIASTAIFARPAKMKVIVEEIRSSLHSVG